MKNNWKVSGGYSHNSNHVKLANISSRSGYWDTEEPIWMPYVGGVLMAIVFAVILFFGL